MYSADLRLVLLLVFLVGTFLVFTTCADTPEPVAPADDVDMLAKPGGEGGKVRTVSAGERPHKLNGGLAC